MSTVNWKTTLYLCVACCIGVHCAVKECYFGASEELPLTDILVTLEDIGSLLYCASICTSRNGCVSFDMCKDNTCRLRAAHVNTTCASGLDCHHYTLRGKDNSCGLIAAHVNTSCTSGLDCDHYTLRGKPVPLTKT
jgi:hypothetical protein